jgi:hypothetical protein
MSNEYQLDTESILAKIVEYEAAKAKKDLDLYERYFYSGQSQEEFAKTVKVNPQMFADIRRRYNLPKQPKAIKKLAKVSKLKNREKEICNHKDCRLCAYMARVWRIDRPVR